MANGIQRHSEVRPAVLWLAALTPIGEAIATWAWSRCADRIYPGWFRKACLEGVPPPFWASDAPVIVPVCKPWPPASECEDASVSQLQSLASRKGDVYSSNSAAESPAGNGNSDLHR